MAVNCNVAKALVKLHGKDEGKAKDLTSARQLVRDLTFDKFDDTLSCGVKQGILLKDYQTFIGNFARRFSLPAEVKDSILDAQYQNNFAEIVLNFKFQKGKTGSYIYGRVATIKHGQQIDMAHSIYTVEFKISPTVTRHEQLEKFLWFTIGTNVWYETRERNLSTEEKDDLKNYLMSRAITGFRSVFSGCDMQLCGDGEFVLHGLCL